MTSIVSPSVTVIVCTRDRSALLEQCVVALSRQAYERFDILVVDNASTHPVAEICSRIGVSWVRAPVPGLTRARNIGARVARGELIAYIDDDAIVEAGWLESLVTDFRDPEIAAVSGRVRYMKALGETRALSAEEAPDNRARPRGRFDRGTADWFSKACFGGIGDGGNMAFRRELIASEVGFDERLGRGRLLDSGDEHVVFASLIARGYRVTHNPDAIVRHPSPPTAELQTLRRLSDLRSSIAYLIFLWYEFPAHRRDILGFLYRALAKRVAAPPGQQRPETARLSRARALKTALEGIFVYASARREWAAIRERGPEEVPDSKPNFINPAPDATRGSIFG